MKAGKCSLKKILNGAVQFHVPIYQRKYSWKEEQCKQLWNDIIAISGKEVNLILLALLYTLTWVHH